MRQWQVWAVSASGQVMMFGLSAPDHDLATAQAERILPFEPETLRVTQL